MSDSSTSTLAPQRDTQPVSRGLFSPIVIIGVLFFMFGFVTWLNGTLIQFFDLVGEQALLIPFAFFIAYFVLALPSSYILKVTGYKNGMALGLFIMAIGCSLFIPAATTRTFGLFLTGLFIQASGMALLQTACNPYVSILGPIESAANRISIMGICNKLAGIFTIFLGAVILKNATKIEEQLKVTTDAVLKNTMLQELASRLIIPYIVLTIVLVVLAIAIKMSSLPEITMEEDEADNSTVASRSSIFQYPHVWLGFICIFVYVGAEVMAGDVIGLYGKSSNIPLEVTKFFTPATLVAMLVGYIVGIITIPKYISQDKALRICAILGAVFTVGAYFASGYMAIAMIVLLGLANSLMWPAIFPLGIDGLGKFTKVGAAILIMGIAGGAIIPLIYGGLYNPKAIFSFLYSPSIDYKLAFLICTFPCYLYILYYAVAGHKVKNPKYL
ncbi:L-fucose-proton symporter [compost metagenome]